MALIIVISAIRCQEDVEWRDCDLDKYNSENESIYDFIIPDIHGTNNVSLKDYQNKVVIIVNVATYWGHTPHYLDYNALTSNYSAQPFVILGFPCNSFGKQEPGANAEEILNGVKHVRPGKGFVPNFQLFNKMDVNGEKEHPLYTYLKKYCPSPRQGFAKKEVLFYETLHADDIRWNFEKFLVTNSGKPIRRYHSKVNPMDIRPHIDQLITQQQQQEI